MEATHKGSINIGGRVRVRVNLSNIIILTLHVLLKGLAYVEIDFSHLEIFLYHNNDGYRLCHLLQEINS